MTLTGMKKHVGILEQAGLVTMEKVGCVRTCKLACTGWRRGAMDREVTFPQLKIHWNEHESYRRQAAKPHGRPLLFFLRNSPRKISRTSLSLDLPSSFTNLATVDLGTPALAAISAVDSKANS